MSRSEYRRSAGVLLHPTSLPGPSGIGDLGAEAYRFVDFLADAGQRLWQILPLGPVGNANSPYDCSSAFAGNPLLIAESWLVQYGLLRPSDIPPDLPATDKVDFSQARARKEPLLREAFARFSSEPDPRLDHHFDEFRQSECSWLDDFALFCALSDKFEGSAWLDWDSGISSRDPEVLARIKAELARDVRYHEFVQFLFDQQWRALFRYAGLHDVRIVGDIPIYVSLNSSDVWAHQDLFELDATGHPTVVAGVPPDYFSATGQLWGNPCYRWDRIARQNYRWWLERFRRALSWHDMVRVDHFRAFQAGWQVSADEDTAINGHWVDGPADELFKRVNAELGTVPIVVEDLGLITEDVDQLRERLGLPGMKVLHFAFGDDSRNPYLPHNYESTCVVYTGTHDNDTTVGWFSQLDQETRRRAECYIGPGSEEINWALIRLAYRSVADLAIVPAQDLLGLGSEHRMNIPGTSAGNWEWRMTSGALAPEIAERLRTLAEIYGRV